jgi:hypothetical protein
VYVGFQIVYDNYIYIKRNSPETGRNFSFHFLPSYYFFFFCCVEISDDCLHESTTVLVALPRDIINPMQMINATITASGHILSFRISFIITGWFIHHDVKSENSAIA